MKKFIQQHKLLFTSIVLSFTIAVIFSILSILTFSDDYTTLSDILGFTFIPLFPVLLILLISFIATKTYAKHPKITKIITGTIITLILLLQVLISFFVFSIESAFNNKHYDKPQSYIQALHSIHRPRCIEHFPERIPPNARNIKMKKYENSWFGSEEIFLKFDIDEKYIENELKKYKFVYIENAETTEHAFAKYLLNEADVPYEQEKNFTFYIINDKQSEVPPQNKFLYHYGIITNDNKTTIIYYYINPD